MYISFTSKNKTSFNASIFFSVSFSLFLQFECFEPTQKNNKHLHVQWAHLMGEKKMDFDSYSIADLFFPMGENGLVRMIGQTQSPVIHRQFSMKICASTIDSLSLPSEISELTVRAVNLFICKIMLNYVIIMKFFISWALFWIEKIFKNTCHHLFRFRFIFFSNE